ncbi:hypothetical protein ACFY71_36365 [Streptomyces cinerochromogenes]|uniref:hypothetical protein n=1 Tax=Streptomyces cinerochromogenes TaxID=66422 RepID=UPI0036C9108B
MTNEPTRCLRPDCRWAPLPALTESGSLEVSQYCSDACAQWMKAALVNARCQDSPAVERQAHRLFLIAELLNLRDHPSDVTFSVTPTPVLMDATAEMGAVDGR